MLKQQSYQIVGKHKKNYRRHKNNYRLHTMGAKNSAASTHEGTTTCVPPSMHNRSTSNRGLKNKLQVVKHSNSSFLCFLHVELGCSFGVSIILKRPWLIRNIDMNNLSHRHVFITTLQDSLDTTEQQFKEHKSNNYNCR